MRRLSACLTTTALLAAARPALADTTPCADCLTPSAQRDRFTAGYQADPTIPEPVLRPDGVRDQAKVHPFEVSTVVSDQPRGTSFTGTRTLDTLARIGAHTASTGAAIPAAFDLWRPSEPLIGSCRDYVFKKWHDYAVFEAHAGACGNDLECVFQEAMSDEGLARPVLYQLDQNHTPIPRQIHGTATSFPRNGFFEIDPREILSRATRYQMTAPQPIWYWDCEEPYGCTQVYGGTTPSQPVDPAFRAAADQLLTATAGHGVTDTGFDPFWWHVDMHDYHASLDLTADDYDAMERRQADYTALLADYRLLSARLAGQQQASVFQPQTTFAGALQVAQTNALLDRWVLQDTIDRMAELLRAEYARADHGCLGNGIACDWSPRRFVRDHVGRFQTEREADLKRCIALTGDNFAGIPTGQRRQIYTPQGWQVAYVGKDDVRALENWFVDQEAVQKLDAESLPWRPSSSEYSGRDTMRWGIAPISEELGVPHLLYGKYEQAGFVELGATVQNDKLCSLEAAAYGKLYARVDWADNTGSHTRTIVDFLLSAGIERERPTGVNGDVIKNDTALDLEGHLLIADEMIVNIPRRTFVGGAVWPGPSGTLQKTWPKSHRFTILGVPAYLKVEIGAAVGFDTALEVPSFADTRSCVDDAQFRQISHTIVARATGSASVEAKGYLGVGLEGLASAGVKGQIQVLRAWLPAYARFGFSADAANNVYLDFETEASLHARLLAGQISVYAELGPFKAEEEIFRWDAIPVDLDLWHFEKRIKLTSLKSAVKGRQ